MSFRWPWSPQRTNPAPTLSPSVFAQYKQNADVQRAFEESRRLAEAQQARIRKEQDDLRLATAESEQEYLTQRLLQDQERLSLKLSELGLVVKKINGDGNCQFSALADQILGAPELHREVRELVIQQLLANKSVYSHFMSGDYDTYCSKMANVGEYGDHITLQAAADAYGIKITCITSSESNPVIEVLPRGHSRTSVNVPDSKIILVFSEMGLHYDSVVSDSQQ
eukprot:TRINITY_DN2832_c0_g1_i3.p1 TRINITY_DN2832_c0_g1~~TRINITY_DN2832_c0_g1_i3.p1  ORF type:complete len:224 (-),score=45.64 TRINITY_DN2832_c0_g1_i3:14-685(-)